MHTKRTKIALVWLVVLAAIAVVLQILNKDTNTIGTVYEIIAFSVAFAAVSLALLQSLDNAKTTRRLEKLIHEMHGLMKIEAKDRERDLKLKKEIKKDLELDAKELKILEEYEKNDQSRNSS
ncbi:hypothetical protein FWF93_00785 [Candidatus Saccharibacteria bacterium]|nr:hypothetical protein [Candidatus Saccharibacteria bacterium]